MQVHRVQQPTKPDQKDQNRQSIAYFLNLDAEVTVAPLNEDVCWNNCETVCSYQFEPFSIHQFIETKSTAAYGGKSSTP